MEDAAGVDDSILRPPWGRLGRPFTLGIVSGWCKLVLRVLNTTTFEDKARFTSTVMEREPGVGLLTVSNHTSTLDDPGLLSALLPWSYFWTEGYAHTGMRWTLCAQEICFKNDLLRQFFLNGKTLPIQRGGGVNQAIMSVTARRLAAGDWVHVFPEGRITLTGDMGPFRWGVGKLVCDSRRESGRDPVVLPLFHSGMGKVVPIKSYLPSVGRDVHIVVGEPLDLSDVTCRCNVEGEDQAAVWRDIALKMREALRKLEARSPKNGPQLVPAAAAPPAVPRVPTQEPQL